MIKIVSLIIGGLVLLSVLSFGYLTYVQNFDLGTVTQSVTKENAKEKTETFSFSGKSMSPNLLDGQYWISDKTAYISNNPQRGDVVTFKDLQDPSKINAKRIVGLPGEDIEIKEGQVYINGQVINEPYLEQGVVTSSVDYPKEGEKLAIPNDQYYILGDNRPYSSDSRIFGNVPKANITGKLTTCYKGCNK